MRFAFICMVAALYLGGCATVARGSNTKMVVDTQPQGAVVSTDLETKDSRRARKRDATVPAQYYGCPATPCEFKMPRRSLFIMTIDHPDHDPIQIGVDHSLHKESLNANLAGSAGTGAAVGVGVGALGASLASAGYISSGTAAAGAGLAMATVTAGVAVVSLGVDGATGALLNLNPNPVFIALPPKGTPIEEDPKITVVREKRAGTYKKKSKSKDGEESSESDAILE